MYNKQMQCRRSLQYDAGAGVKIGSDFMSDKTIIVAIEITVDEYKNLAGVTEHKECGNCQWHNTSDDDTDWWSCSLFYGGTNGGTRVKECIEAEELFLAQIAIH